MCGICGFTRTGQDNELDLKQSLSVVQDMCEVISHRGPDGEGFLVDNEIALGHRRLSLIDLEGGSQPMSRDGFYDARTFTSGDGYVPTWTVEADTNAKNTDTESGDGGDKITNARHRKTDCQCEKNGICEIAYSPAEEKESISENESGFATDDESKTDSEKKAAPEAESAGNASPFSLEEYTSVVFSAIAAASLYAFSLPVAIPAPINETGNEDDGSGNDSSSENDNGGDRLDNGKEEVDGSSSGMSSGMEDNSDSGAESNARTSQASDADTNENAEIKEDVLDAARATCDIDMGASLIDSSNMRAIGKDLRFCRPREFSVVFNGEIYNYRDLRIELEEEGWEFSTNSDTEILLASFIQWGTACLPKLRGMFAFAVYNRVNRTMFLARDAFGIKPLYWTIADDGELVFASEIKAILEYPFVEKHLNFHALEHYLSFQYSMTDETFFQGIMKLPAGHYLIYDCDDESVFCARWFLPTYEENYRLTMGAASDQIADVIRDSVDYHRIADVEVGSFLSSGVDSNYLAASLAAVDPSIKTFTVGFDTEDGRKYNEIDYAHAAAEHLGVEHITHVIEPDEFWEDFPKIQWHMDEPLADPAAAALWFVDKEAAKHVKAVLSGEGADELFAGYQIYLTPLANRKITWIPRPILSGMRRIMGKLGIRGTNYLDRAMNSVESYFIGNANIFSEQEKDDILRVYCDDAGLSVFSGIPSTEMLAETYDRVWDQDDVKKMQYVDLNHWLAGDILLKTDKMAMAHSLESRVPFLDKEVWELSRTIPTKLNVGRGKTKRALRKAASKVMPAQYISKPKLGFPVPIRVWLTQEKYLNKVRQAICGETAEAFFNTEYAEQLLDDHIAGVADNSRKIWTLYSFIVWYEQYFGDQVDSE